MREYLKQIMESSTYDLNRERVPDYDGDEYTSHRVQMISKVITAYRTRAWNKLLEEDSDLKKMVYQDKINAKSVKGGRLSGVVEIAQ